MAWCVPDVQRSLTVTSPGVRALLSCSSTAWQSPGSRTGAAGSTAEPPRHVPQHSSETGKLLQTSAPNMTSSSFNNTTTNLFQDGITSRHKRFQLLLSLFPLLLLLLRGGLYLHSSVLTVPERDRCLIYRGPTRRNPIILWQKEQLTIIHHLMEI